MTTPDEPAVYGFTPFERDARKDALPAAPHEPGAEGSKPNANVTLIGERAPGGLASRALSAEVDETRAQPRSKREHGARRQGIHVELKGVGALGLPRALL
jgi:hypothetical protein